VVPVGATPHNAQVKIDFGGSGNTQHRNLYQTESAFNPKTSLERQRHR
jgi:hypothetical protein